MGHVGCVSTFCLTLTFTFSIPPTSSVSCVLVSMRMTGEVGKERALLPLRRTLRVPALLFRSPHLCFAVARDSFDLAPHRTQFCARSDDTTDLSSIDTMDWGRGGGRGGRGRGGGRGGFGISRQIKYSEMSEDAGFYGVEEVALRQCSAGDRTAVH
jgi:hypothetical protein